MGISQIELDATAGDDIIVRRAEHGSMLLEMEVIDGEGDIRHVRTNGPSLRDALTLLFPPMSGCC